jgi:hypothetical protein
MNKTENQKDRKCKYCNSKVIILPNEFSDETGSTHYEKCTVCHKERDL